MLRPILAAALAFGVLSGGAAAATTAGSQYQMTFGSWTFDGSNRWSGARVNAHDSNEDGKLTTDEVTFFRGVDDNSGGPYGYTTRADSVASLDIDIADRSGRVSLVFTGTRTECSPSDAIGRCAPDAYVWEYDFRYTRSMRLNEIRGGAISGATVPLPSSALLLLGAVGLLGARRRFSRA